MVNTQKKMSKLIDAFEEKTLREMDKMIKCIRQEVTKRTETIENSFRQLRRQITKLCGAGDDSTSGDDANENEEEKFYPFEICSPLEFVEKYVMSDEDTRPPFLIHYLEARFGDHYRGDRYGGCWKKRKGKYVTCTFEEILEWLSPNKTIMFQKKACLRDPRDYRDEEEDPEYFERWRNAWMEEPLALDRDTLKKFLCYKHKNLPNLRR